MTTIPVDYEILRLLWWLFLGVLLIGFAIMDGFDHAIGPVWEGNQVWLILGGGVAPAMAAILPAWPTRYTKTNSCLDR